jgi:hypothetical protein
MLTLDTVTSPSSLASPDQRDIAGIQVAVVGTKAGSVCFAELRAQIRDGVNDVHFLFPWKRGLGCGSEFGRLEARKATTRRERALIRRAAVFSRPAHRLPAAPPGALICYNRRPASC